MHVQTSEPKVNGVAPFDLSCTLLIKVFLNFRHEVTISSLFKIKITEQQMKRKQQFYI